MKFKSTMFAILLGLAAMGVPAIASAHPWHRGANRAYHRAIVSQRFHSMPYASRQRFLSNHPYLANHHWMLNRPYAAQNSARGARWNWKHRNAWNNGYQGIYNREPDGDEYGAQGYAYAQRGWRHREPDRDDYQGACGGDGDADDCGPAAYTYGAPSYGYGSPYNGNPYGGYGMSGMLPMLQQFIP
jgi:hypothetical protein